MNTRHIFRASWLRILTLAFLAAALPLRAAPEPSAPIRVTTWNLQPDSTAGTNGWSGKFQQSLVQQAADSLKKLNPDVIVLQQVAGWETCRQLAQELLPEVYHVTICSSFRDARTKLLSPQVAILTKAKSYISWSDSWPGGGESPAAPGGFAFAAIRSGSKNVGIFSVQLSDGASNGTDDVRSDAAQNARAESARQLVKEIASLQNWKTNRIDAFIVAGDFNTTADDTHLAREQTLPLLEQSGFASAFAGLPLDQRVTRPGNAVRPDATLDYLFLRDAGLVAGPMLTQTALSGHSGVTCDLDLAAPKRIAAPATQIARVELPPAIPQATPSATPPAKPTATPAANPITNLALAPATLAKASSPPETFKIIWWAAGIFVFAVMLFMVARKFSHRTRLQPTLAMLPETKPKPLITFTKSDQIISAPPVEHAPFVHIAMGSSSQTQSQSQSQSWPARPEPARPEPARPKAPLPEEVRAGVVANLTRWLKQKFVQRLISDRAQLLATQQDAALKVLAVDERLTKIEQQIQQRNLEYEKRIDELQLELLTAKEENRELIRAKIALVKAEMEKARLRARQQASEHQQN